MVDTRRTVIYFLSLFIARKDHSVHNIELCLLKEQGNLNNT